MREGDEHVKRWWKGVVKVGKGMCFLRDWVFLLKLQYDLVENESVGDQEMNQRRMVVEVCLLCPVCWSDEMTSGWRKVSSWMNKKWNEWCFRPWFCTVRLRDNLGEWDEFCYESCLWCRIDRSTCWPVVQCATIVPWMPPSGWIRQTALNSTHSSIDSNRYE